MSGAGLGGTLRVEDGIAIVTIDNPPVNAAAHAVRQLLADALAQTEADPKVSAVVLTCAGRTFVAGADVREFGAPPKEPQLPEVVHILETARKPWVAAIHGTALGGGLEIALGCAYRVAVASAKMGLPEVNLGLIPGAGGTVRLPRVVAADEALAMIASGKPITAAKAFEIGLLDQVVEGDLVDEAIDFARRVARDACPAPVLHRPAIAPPDESAWATQKAQLAKRAKGAKAPLVAIDAVQDALDLEASEALDKERSRFIALKNDPQSAALSYIFFAERGVGKGLVPKETQPQPFEKIGVIGGGTMGAGIAAACVLAGLNVTLIERDDASLSAGRDRVMGILEASLKRGLISAEKHAGLISAFASSTEYSALSQADLVIEAVFEDLGVKKDVFARLEAACPPKAILATNTSYLDVAEIAKAVSDPARVIGLHFFSPAHIMKLLELVLPDSASPEAIATGLALGKRLGKITVPAGVCDGFIGNRIMSAYRNSCDAMLLEGARPQEIDAAMRGFGWPMGLYEMQDMAGLDIAWATRKRKAATRDPEAPYLDTADQLCEAGHFGRKTGQGWYIHTGDTPEVNPEALNMLAAEAARKGIAPKVFTAQDIVDRIVAAMQSEAALILKEEIAQRPEDVDVVMVNGYGFPRWRGGPMFLAKH